MFLVYFLVVYWLNVEDDVVRLKVTKLTALAVMLCRGIDDDNSQIHNPYNCVLSLKRCLRSLHNVHML